MPTPSTSRLQDDDQRAADLAVRMSWPRNSTLERCNLIRIGSVFEGSTTEMDLTHLERDFLQRLADHAWTSPPLFDHGLIARLVEAGFVRARPLGAGRVHYEVTSAGRAALSTQKSE